MTLDSQPHVYDAADQMLSGPGATYTYDANGNMLTRSPNQTFTYDHENRLTQVVIGGNTTAITYDGDGMRVRRVVGAVTTNYVMDVNTPLPVVLYDGSAWYLYGLDLVARITTGDQTYFHADGLGSIRALTDANGDAQITYDYDVFGEPRFVSDGSPNYFRFAGEQLDPSTSLYNLRARYYAPAAGRFMSRDPFPGLATNPQSQHPYAYVGNNPTNQVDPSGLAAAPPVGKELGTRQVDYPPLFGVDLRCLFFASPRRCVSDIGVGGGEGPVKAPMDLPGAYRFRSRRMV